MTISKIQSESINRSDLTGSILQIKSFTLTSATSSTADGFVDTGLQLAITPSSASSKILITGFINVGASYFKTYIRLLRDSTVLSVGDSASNRPQVYSSSAPGGSDWDEYNVTSLSLNLLDSPNTTSSVTYKVQYRPYDNTATTAFINRSSADRDNADYDERSISVMTLQEIAG
tara:strand:- start:105 stop:626 length:522 start_codon:yes stop_codon:yes gene_type:complete